LDEETDLPQMIRNKTMITTETEEYITKSQMPGVQYDTMYEYGQNTTIQYNDTTNDISKNQTLVSEKEYPLEDMEEPYDYEKLKMEYEQQLAYNIKHHKVFNYTEKEEDTPKKALNEIIKQAKNCTKKELKKIKIIKCLIRDYRRTKDIVAIKKILYKAWLIIKIWFLIYVCVAIPCWCQRGNLINAFSFDYFYYSLLL